MYDQTRFEPSTCVMLQKPNLSCKNGGEGFTRPTFPQKRDEFCGVVIIIGFCGHCYGRKSWSDEVTIEIKLELQRER
ncbi:hypothetical protein HanXRQr2_Chr15g0687561 [Helianthus annuus]|uniref:Uncharacterized protein n=1 Tax=Helianthus annuus TaxID=4232 RepID=A0A9K3DYZ9_HELAN|nr:hypothetical protein HanXRQr2_Chr15g0687561 [Helianthus annuus]KAJ0830797.1 hypothetical protein HanPSC8_Chr15g0659571 [Helianthus annuus]